MDLVKKKIVVVTHYYGSHGGGIEIVAQQINRRLVESFGHKVVWFSSNTDCPPTIDGIKTVPIRTFNGVEKILGTPCPLWFIGPRALNSMRSALKNGDVLFIHDFFYSGNIFMFFLAKFYRKPIIMVQHLGYYPFRNPFLQGIHFLLESSLGRLMFFFSNRLIFISYQVKNYFLRKMPQLIDRMDVIPNGVDSEIYFPVDAEKRIALCQEQNLQIKKMKILFVGRFVEKKGLRLILSLAKIFSDFQWVLIGWGPMRVEDWNLDNVVIHRNLEAKSVPTFYQACDLLILPSRGEGFPLVIQESMACGTPALVSEECANAYPINHELIFQEHLGGDDELERWSNALHKTTSSVFGNQALRKNVANFAKHHWDWNQSIRRYAEIIHEIIQ